MALRKMPERLRYREAVQQPAICFSDPVLQQAIPRKNSRGQPQAISGQSAVVFPMDAPSDKRYAVKCFTHDAPGQLGRYQLIHDELARLKPAWATDFDFQPEGIRVIGQRYPILRMTWVEGVTLLAWLDQNYQHRGAVARLATSFETLAQELADAGIAHGDLQHGNILVQSNGMLRLVDYDCMYLPGVGLKQFPSDEVGLPAYQPPTRTVADYGPDMDRFSVWLIYLSLKALAADPSLWERCNPSKGDYLLLDGSDLEDPDASQRLAILGSHTHARARELGEFVRESLRRPLSAIPSFGTQGTAGRRSTPTAPSAPTTSATSQSSAQFEGYRQLKDAMERLTQSRPEMPPPRSPPQGSASAAPATPRSTSPPARQTSSPTGSGPSTSLKKPAPKTRSMGHRRVIGPIAIGLVVVGVSAGIGWATWSTWSAVHHSSGPSNGTMLWSDQSLQLGNYQGLNFDGSTIYDLTSTTYTDMAVENGMVYAVTALAALPAGESPTYQNCLHAIKGAQHNALSLRSIVPGVTGNICAYAKPDGIAYIHVTGGNHSSNLAFDITVWQYTP